MLRNILASFFFLLLVSFAFAQQADSDRKDAVGHARPAPVATISKEKPASDKKADVQQPKNNTSPNPKPAVDNSKLISDKK